MPTTLPLANYVSGAMCGHITFLNRSTELEEIIPIISHKIDVIHLFYDSFNFTSRKRLTPFHIFGCNSAFEFIIRYYYYYYYYYEMLVIYKKNYK